MLGSLCHPFLFLFWFWFWFLHFQTVLPSFNLSSPPSAQKLCSPEQSLALLHFKNSTSIHDFCLFYPKTNSWKEDMDCCSWDGITCDGFRGHVVGLDLSSSCLSGIIDDSSSLFLLRHLQKLNLAFNGFQYIISSKFGQFKELTHLNLSGNRNPILSASPIPIEILYLSELVSLDLSHFTNPGEGLSQDIINRMAQNLTKLRYLYLDGIDVSSIAPVSLVNLSSSLISLSLADTDLEGRFPSDIFRLPFLQQLRLSDNPLLTGNLPKTNWSGPLRFLDLSYTSSSSTEHPDTIGNLKYLVVLHLASSNFRGSIPASLGNLTEIISLDLTSNNFIGEIPPSISNLWELTSLNLKDNNFSGQFPDVFGNLSKLIDLSLSNNSFTGQIPSSAFNLTRIPTLDFSRNRFEGQIPSQVSRLSDLTALDLSCNFLRGEIPFWLFTLTSLNSLDLSNNKLTGRFPNIMFPNFNLSRFDLSSNNLSGTLKSDVLLELKNLEIIDLSHNNLLSLTPHSNTNFSLPKLRQFSFSSCNLTEFPSFLRNAENLFALDLSNNKISGQISPGDFSSWSNLNYLNLSQNFLTRFVQLPSRVRVLDLHSNMLQGTLPDLPTTLFALSASNNKLTGEIPSSFCNLTSLQNLRLSNNSFTGTIPHCLGRSCQLIFFLDLRMNNFHGSIPQTLAVGPIQYLNLNGNRLVGPLPPYFVNCIELEVLDLGNNKINDTFPSWLESCPKLKVLILRANEFHGPISNSNARYSFTELRILDVSRNQFTGLLPTGYFENFKYMMLGPYDNTELRDMKNNFHIITFQYYSVVLTMKGVELKVERILTTFTIIDFSNNLFQGGIPGVLGKLILLKELNFSRNKLTGEIPFSLENLMELESLDLSSNKLIGKIPTALTSLTFLAVLNLSYNQLLDLYPKESNLTRFKMTLLLETWGSVDYH